MSIISKPHGDFTNNVDVANATYVNDQMNTAYNAINGGLDYNNVPTVGNPSSLQTTAQDTLVNAINEVNTKGSIDFMSRQALINGNFDVWQRGTSFTNPANSTYTPDRWVALNTSDGGTFPNVTISRQTLTQGDIQGSFYFDRVNTDGAGTSLGTNSLYRKNQRIENGTRYLAGAGKKVTLSFWARSSITNKKIGIFVSQVYGTGGSPSSGETINGTKFILTSTWTKYTYTFTTNTLVGKTFGTNNDDYLQVSLNYVWGASVASFVGDTVAETFVGAGNIDIAQVGFNAGDQALPFQPRSFAEELALCQRYYEKSYDYQAAAASGSEFGAIEYQISTANINYSAAYKTQKRTNPTVTIYSKAGVSGKVSNTTDSTEITIAGVVSGMGGFIIYGSAPAANKVLEFQFTSDAEL